MILLYRLPHADFAYPPHSCYLTSRRNDDTETRSVPLLPIDVSSSIEANSTHVGDLRVALSSIHLSKALDNP